MDLANPRVNSGDNIPDTEEGVDIGPATAKLFAEVLAGREDGPVERPDGHLRGPALRRRHLRRGPGGGGSHQKNGAKSIIGGGDSVKAINKAGWASQVTFMSTGGGASLEFLEGKTLPGVAALQDV
jgi:phosphoglycerate kinase